MENNLSGTYMKLMNDIDMVGQSNYRASLGFQLKGVLDGNNKTITNLRTGGGFGLFLSVYNGFSLTNITFHYTTGITTELSPFIGQVQDTLTFITIQNVHIIADGTSHLSGLMVGGSIGSTSVISNIIVEGNVQFCFSSTFMGDVEYVRLYRVSPPISWEYYLPYLFKEVRGTISRCQIVVPSFELTGTIGGV
jgi:hypothetical protein